MQAMELHLQGIPDVGLLGLALGSRHEIHFDRGRRTGLMQDARALGCWAFFVGFHLRISMRSTPLPRKGFPAGPRAQGCRCRRFARHGCMASGSGWRTRDPSSLQWGLELLRVKYQSKCSSSFVRMVEAPQAAVA